MCREINLDMDKIKCLPIDTVEERIGFLRVILERYQRALLEVASAQKQGADLQEGSSIEEARVSDRRNAPHSH